jgi:deazaflavin-dependent oxidoreductase (nitroreductase family)
MTKRQVVHFFQKYLFNPPVRLLARAGLAPSVALLETTGRKSGQPRHTPVGNGLVRGTDTFWLVAEHGASASYVRNIEANPRVRVKLGRRWRSGTAHLLPDDDPIARQRSMPHVNARAVRAMGTDLLSIRIDLE